MTIGGLQRRVTMQTLVVIILLYAIYGSFCLLIARKVGQSAGMAAVYCFWIPTVFLFLMHVMHCAVMARFSGIKWVGDSFLLAGNRIFLQRLCAKYKIGNLRVGLAETRVSNAFVFGTRWKPRLVITQGMIESLTEDELNAVIAHEIAHLRHYDVIFLGVSVMIYMLLKAEAQRMKWRSFHGALAIGYVLDFCALAALLIYVKLSRTREFYADAFSAAETGKPESLASALLKIEFGSSASRARLFKDLESHDGRVKRLARKEFEGLKPISALTIADVPSGLERAPQPHALAALKRQLENPWEKLKESVATHPSTAHRINQLGGIAKGMGVPFRHSIPVAKSWNGMQFAVEVLCYFAPYLGIVVGLIFTSSVKSDAAISFFPAFVVAGCLVRTWYRYRGKEVDISATYLSGRTDTNEMMSLRVRMEGELRAKAPYDAPVLVDRSGFVPVFASSYSYLSRRKLAQCVGKSVVIHGWYRSNGVPYVEVQRVEVVGESVAIRAYTREVKAALAVAAVFMGLGYLNSL